MIQSPPFHCICDTALPQQTDFHVVRRCPKTTLVIMPGLNKMHLLPEGARASEWRLGARDRRPV
jgi:hypothetical protein